MTAVHAELAAGRWQALPLVEQLANVGSEIERALAWAAKGNRAYSARALERGLELLGLTISDPHNQRRLRELTRLREALVDYFYCENDYRSSPQSWHSYFHPYAVAVSTFKCGRQPS
jgi:hypothetical protein